MNANTNTFDPSTEGRVVAEPQGRVLSIRIDRPAKRNAFSLAMLRDLADAYTRLEREGDLWVGLLWAEGEHFTAGLQLDQVGPHMAEGKPLFSPECIDPMSLRHPIRTKPVVCAVQGIVFTVGLELMLAQDIVVAADNCRFGQIEVSRGIMPTGGATMRFVERAGWGNAQRYLLTGEEFNAAEALRLGFVQEVVPAGREKDRAMEIALRICEQAPLAVRASLASSRRFAEHGPIAAAQELDATQRNLSQSEDSKEGLLSYLERRKADFKGR
jgi:enoyl-CoA hydratase